MKSLVHTVCAVIFVVIIVIAEQVNSPNAMLLSMLLYHSHAQKMHIIYS